jgi:hypothetical protein
MVDDTSATLKGSGVAMASVKRHHYKMANGHPNMILRAMGYDNFGIKLLNPSDRNVDNGSPPPAVRSSPNLVEQWHSDIVDYALTAPASPGASNAPDVKRSQFQLGFKKFIGPNNKPKKAFKKDAAGNTLDKDGNPTKDPTQFVFDHWEVAGVSDGYLTDPAEIRGRCRMLRTKGVGLILFAMSTSANPAEVNNFWAEVASYNWVLNKAKGLPPLGFDKNPTSKGDPDYDPNKPSVGTNKPAVLSTPRQMPHTKESLQRMAAG